eukprot:TRINITY_DN43415_c0_g1_i1.p1 TRINITY_DN43415_c0_g1~~TRINITY_DN43415_c0_g1_i1.p1  ORF type:complete len:488 (-),score=54.95 TRINITY_DN43415_c0_g1_i1:209-1672(-)
MERQASKAASFRLFLLGPILVAGVAAAAGVAVGLTGEVQPTDSKQGRCTGGVGFIQAASQTRKTSPPRANQVPTENLDKSLQQAPAPHTALGQDVTGHPMDGPVQHHIRFQQALKLCQNASAAALSLLATGTARVSSYLSTSSSTSEISMIWLLLLGAALLCFVAILIGPRWSVSSPPRDLTGLTPPGWRHATVPKASEQRLRLPAHAVSKQASASARGSLAQPQGTASPQPKTPTLLGRLSAVGKAFGEFTPVGQTPSRSPHAAVEADFCPELVVPKECECILLVPLVPLSQGRFSVFDPNGQVVLQVLPKSMGLRPTTSPSPGPGQAIKSILRSRGEQSRLASTESTAVGASWHLELTTGDGALLAQSACQCSTPGKSPECSSQPCFQIMRADGDHYATLRRNQQDGYELVTPAQTIHFWGSFDHYAVNITDDAGKLLATTELMAAEFDLAGEYYQLRVAPLVDVGLLVCSLICIGQVGSLNRRT